MSMDDKTIRAAMRGDKEAARQCTEAGVILPCPFCGRNPETHKAVCFGSAVLCSHTPCRGSGGNWYITMDDALAAWNTRTPLPEEPNEPLTLEELREMDGCPVWDSQRREWALVDYFSNKWVVHNDKHDGILESGRYYRRPPEE